MSSIKDFFNLIPKKLCKGIIKKIFGQYIEDIDARSININEEFGEVERLKLVPENINSKISELPFKLTSGSIGKISLTYKTLLSLTGNKTLNIRNVILNFQTVQSCSSYTDMTEVVVLIVKTIGKIVDSKVFQKEKEIEEYLKRTNDYTLEKIFRSLKINITNIQIFFKVEKENKSSIYNIFLLKIPYLKFFSTRSNEGKQKSKNKKKGNKIYTMDIGDASVRLLKEEHSVFSTMDDTAAALKGLMIRVEMDQIKKKLNFLVDIQNIFVGVLPSTIKTALEIYKKLMKILTSIEKKKGETEKNLNGIKNEISLKKSIFEDEDLLINIAIGVKNVNSILTFNDDAKFNWSQVVANTINRLSVKNGDSITCNLEEISIKKRKKNLIEFELGKCKVSQWFHSVKKTENLFFQTYSHGTPISGKKYSYKKKMNKDKFITIMMRRNNDFEISINSNVIIHFDVTLVQRILDILPPYEDLVLNEVNDILNYPEFDTKVFVPLKRTGSIEKKPIFPFKFMINIENVSFLVLLPSVHRSEKVEKQKNVFHNGVFNGNRFMLKFRNVKLESFRTINKTWELTGEKTSVHLINMKLGESKEIINFGTTKTEIEILNEQFDLELIKKSNFGLYTIFENKKSSFKSNDANFTINIKSEPSAFTISENQLKTCFKMIDVLFKRIITPFKNYIQNKGLKRNIRQKKINYTPSLALKFVNDLISYNFSINKRKYKMDLSDISFDLNVFEGLKEKCESDIRLNMTISSSGFVFKHINTSGSSCYNRNNEERIVINSSKKLVKKYRRLDNFLLLSLSHKSNQTNLRILTNGLNVMLLTFNDMALMDMKEYFIFTDETNEKYRLEVMLCDSVIELQKKMVVNMSKMNLLYDCNVISLDGELMFVLFNGTQAVQSGKSKMLENFEKDCGQHHQYSSYLVSKEYAKIAYAQDFSIALDKKKRIVKMGCKNNLECEFCWNSLKLLAEFMLEKVLKEMILLNGKKVKKEDNDFDEWDVMDFEDDSDNRKEFEKEKDVNDEKQESDELFLNMGENDEKKDGSTRKFQNFQSFRFISDYVPDEKPKQVNNDTEEGIFKLPHFYPPIDFAIELTKLNVLISLFGGEDFLEGMRNVNERITVSLEDLSGRFIKFLGGTNESDTYNWLVNMDLRNCVIFRKTKRKKKEIILEKGIRELSFFKLKSELMYGNKGTFDVEFNPIYDISIRQKVASFFKDFMRNIMKGNGVFKLLNRSMDLIETKKEGSETFQVDSLKSNSMNMVLNLETDFLDFKDVEIPFEEIVLTNSCSITKTVEEITKHILTNTSTMYLFSMFLMEITPIKRVRNVSKGAIDLVRIPLKSYKDDGKIVSGMKKGFIEFIKTITKESAGGTADLLRVGNDNNEENEDIGRSKNIVDGFKKSYFYVVKSSKEAFDIVLAIPNSKEGKLGKSLKQLPVAVIAPIKGVLNGLSKIFEGIEGEFK